MLIASLFQIRKVLHNQGIATEEGVIIHSVYTPWDVIPLAEGNHCHI